MRELRFRHRVLVSACCMALCYLFAASTPAAAQAPTGCLPATNPPPNCHVVQVGPPTQAEPFGGAHFQDLDSGSRSDDPNLGGGNPVITVIPVGHTIQWQFFYGHSSQSGTCPFVGSGTCTPSNPLLWDSGIRSGNLSGTDIFTRTFNQPGVFTYFCGVHFGLMRGIVIVLMNSQDYDLLANPDPTIGPPPPMPTQTIFAGGTATFAGNLNSYKNFISTLTLSCQNGNPRAPSNCPTTPPITVVPAAGAFFATTPLTFPVSEAVGGDYTFDIVANPQPPAATPFTHRKTVLLHVNDLGLSLGSTSLSALRGQTAQTTAQATGLGQFGGNVTMSCNVLPAGGPSCAVAPSSFVLAAGGTQNLNVSLTTGAAASNNYNVNVVASSSAINPGPGAFTRSNSLNLALKAAESLAVTSTVSSAAPGQQFAVVVRAVDGSGTQMTNYNGTVQFSSSDALAGLPGSYTFTSPGDNGLKIFNVTFNSVGPQTVTVTDTTPFSTTGTSSIVRVDGPDIESTVTLEPVPTPMQDAYFQKEQVTFKVTVGGISASPQGSVQFYDGAKPIGAPVALPGGPSISKAVNKTFTLTVGDHAISAVFLPSTGTANMSDTQMQRRFPTPRCANNICPGSH